MHLTNDMHPFNILLCFSEFIDYSDIKLQNVLHFKTSGTNTSFKIQANMPSVFARETDHTLPLQSKDNHEDFQVIHNCFLTEWLVNTTVD